MATGLVTYGLSRVIMYANNTCGFRTKKRFTQSKCRRAERMTVDTAGLLVILGGFI